MSAPNVAGGAAQLSSRLPVPRALIVTARSACDEAVPASHTERSVLDRHAAKRRLAITVVERRFQIVANAGDAEC